MPAVTRNEIDASMGHDGYPARPTDSAGQSTVFVNGVLSTIVGAHYPTHCNSDCHDGLASTGSDTVMINGISIHRIGDAISCEDVSGHGSPNVFSG